MDLPKTTRLAFPFILSFSLVACGGGGGFSGDSSTGTSTTGSSTTTETSTEETTTESKVSTLRLTSSSLQLQSSGENPITLSAIAKDANNILLDDAEIEITVDNDALLTSTTGTSIRTATLTPDIPTNRMLNAKATVGGLTETLQIEVVGTTIALEGAENIIVDQPSEYKLIARDSASNPIGSQSAALPAVAGPCSLTSTDTAAALDSAGEYTFSLKGTAEGACTLTASDFGAEASLEINVSGAGDAFTISAVSDKANDVTDGDDEVLEIPVNTTETIQLSYKKDNAAQPSKTILLSATRGSIPASVVTDANGEASFDISSSNSGTTVITASVDGLKAVLKDVEFVAENPVYISTQASPSIVKPLEKSIITTQIQDVNNNPVKNKTIVFTLSDTVGGSLNASEAKTDSLGRASVEYTAGNTSSEADGVVITSNIQGATTISDEIKLTVGGEALRVVLGTNNKLIASDLTYTKQYIVMVTDSAGNPVVDQEVNFSLVPEAFYKGIMVPVDTDGEPVDTDGDAKADTWSDFALLPPVNSVPDYVSTKYCLSEDKNDNGYLDSDDDGDGDNILEPTHDASVTSASGSNMTGSDGSLVLEVTYPKSRALWSEQRLAVRVSVDGTEYEESDTFRLEVVKDDVSDASVSPPNPNSPYGKYADCSIPN